jgi:diguanylate cyclase (GGDEF)-like protein/PAS domain S-box-containing protein
MSEAWSLPEGMLDALPDGVYFVDRDRTVTYWNAAASSISGFPANEMLGHWCGDGLLSHVDENGRGLCGERCPLLATIGDGEVRSTQVMLHHRDGHMVPVEIRAAPMRDAQGNIVGAIEMFRDDTARFAEPTRVREIDVAGGMDPVTGLGNRRSLEAHLVERLAALARRDVPLGVLVCRVDDFRALDEAHGHEVADRVLQVVADTLVHCLPGRGRLFRSAGDQFVGLVAHDDLAVFGTRLCAYVEDSRIGLEDDVLKASISIGATMAGRGEDYSDVLRRAERLLAAATTAGGNCVVTDGETQPPAEG